MKRNIIIIVVLGLVLGLAVYALTDKDKSPQVADKGLEDNLNEEGTIDEEDINEVEDKEVEDEEVEDFQPSIAIGEKLPNFTLKDLEGQDVSLADYEDKIVFLNFWATWCVYCDAEMPDLQRLSEENDDLVVLGVNIEEKKLVVEKYVDEGGYDFKIVLDEKGKVAREYLVGPLPSTYFTNDEGVFLGRIEGMLTYEQMNEILEDIRNNH